MAKGIPVRGTEATIYEPTEKYKSWRITYIDRATNKRKTTSGGKTREEAEDKARHLSGEYVEGWRNGDTPPTLQETVDLWLTANRSEWSSRTYDHYSYLAAKFTERYGSRPITQVSPVDIAKVDFRGHSRGQQEKARTLLRGILRHSGGWLERDPIRIEKKVESLVRAIALSGNASGKRNQKVERGDIPSSKFVAALIITANHTLQQGPLNDPEYTDIDKRSGLPHYRSGSVRSESGTGLVHPLEDRFIRGLPAEWTESHRRGIPKHYKNPEGRRRAETMELASRYRQIGLAVALGAGGGLRIGEVLALRVRHFLEPADVSLIHSLNWELGATNSDGSLNYSGRLDVSEQASQGSRGKIWITGTKGVEKSRIVHLPAFLPNWNSTGYGSQRPLIERSEPRFEDRSISLWEATEEESIRLWRAGFTPLNYLLWLRLKELWNHPAIKHRNSLGARIKDFRELLMFPTRNPARTRATGTPMVQIDPGWRKSIALVEGDGTYQAQSNYAKHANTLYDYVEQEFDEHPEHRTNAKGRKGWTHHGLRHWAVSSRIQAGVPLPLIAREMGHHDSSFTLERYGHVMDQGVGPGGFEY
ncbi:integrase [Microbacterium sp. W4I20]|nr:integrase [Microbacterium sp. W4I20]